MSRSIALLAAIAFCGPSAAHADYGVTRKGTWPTSWPKELEPLRQQASTFEGPRAPHQHYAITFTNREQFESAWPHLLKVKSKGAPIRLLRGPNFFLGEHVKAGVIVHAPPRAQADDPATSQPSTYIELVVDGELIDLNRIALPPDTPIIDERFKK